MTATHTLTFSVSGTATQSLRIIDNAYTGSDIALMLNQGKLVTTTWFNRANGFFEANIADASGHVVAEILSQEIDADYRDFDVN